MNLNCDEIVTFVTIKTNNMLLLCIDKTNHARYMDINYEILTACILFHGLTAEEIEEALSHCIYQRKVFVADQPLAHIGTDCDRLMIIIQGEVRGEMTDRTGKTIKIEDIKAPSPVASAFIFGQQNRFPVNIIANTQSEAIILYRDQLLTLFQSNKQILSNFLTLISNRAQFLSQKIKFLSFGTIREKLAHYILNKLGDKLHSFVMDKTQQELADLFGVQRPSLARTLGELQDENIISIKQKTVTLINKEALRSMIN